MEQWLEGLGLKQAVKGQQLAGYNKVWQLFTRKDSKSLEPLDTTNPGKVWENLCDTLEQQPHAAFPLGERLQPGRKAAVALTMHFELGCNPSQLEFNDLALEIVVKIQEILASYGHVARGTGTINSNCLLFVSDYTASCSIKVHSLRVVLPHLWCQPGVYTELSALLLENIESAELISKYLKQQPLCNEYLGKTSNVHVVYRCVNTQDIRAPFSFMGYYAPLGERKFLTCDEFFPCKHPDAPKVFTIDEQLSECVPQNQEELLEPFFPILFSANYQTPTFAQLGSLHAVRSSRIPRLSHHGEAEPSVNATRKRLSTMLDTVQVPNNSSWKKQRINDDLETNDEMEIDGEGEDTVESSEETVPEIPKPRNGRRTAAQREEGRRGRANAQQRAERHVLGGDLSLLQNQEAERLLPVLLPMLGLHRVTDSWNWLAVGKAIHSTMLGNTEGLEIWWKWTEDIGGDARQYVDCQRQYVLFAKVEHITVKTIAFMAREDNEESYRSWHRQWVVEAIDACLDKQLHADVALAVYRHYWLEFMVVCNGGSRFQWFVFKNHGWLTDSGLNLSRCISWEFTTLLTKYHMNLLHDTVRLSMNDPMRSDIDRRARQITTLNDNLKNGTFKGRVIVELRDWFICNDFKNIKNKNPALIRWSNGVTECLNDRCVLRKGRPEDYLTMSAGTAIPTDYTLETPVVQKLLRFWSQLFPDPMYWRKTMSSLLYGKNIKKRFHILSGEAGDNAKTTIETLNSHVLGQYSATLTTDAFRSMGTCVGGVSPDLARLANVHAVWVSEADETDKFKGGPIKKLTGNDRFFARGLYEEGSDLEMTFSTFCQLNSIPSIETGGQAIVNRLIVLNMLARYLPQGHPDLPETVEEQEEKHIYLRDDNFFSNEIPLLVPAMAWLMMHDYAILQTQGYDVPASVKSDTDFYWRKASAYRQFFDNHIEKRMVSNKLDQSVKLTTSELYSAFLKFYKAEFDQSSRVQKQQSEVVTNFMQFLGTQPRPGMWFGYALKGDYQRQTNA